MRDMKTVDCSTWQEIIDFVTYKVLYEVREQIFPSVLYKVVKGTKDNSANIIRNTVLNTLLP